MQKQVCQSTLRRNISRAIMRPSLTALAFWDSAYLTWARELWEGSIQSLTTLLGSPENANAASIPRLWPLSGPAQEGQRYKLTCPPSRPFIEGMSARELPTKCPKALELPVQHERAAFVLSALTAYVHEDADTIASLQQQDPDTMVTLQMSLLHAVEQRQLLRLSVASARSEGGWEASALPSTAAAQQSQKQRAKPKPSGGEPVHIPPGSIPKDASHVQRLCCLMAIPQLSMGRLQSRGGRKGLLVHVLASAACGENTEAGRQVAVPSASGTACLHVAVENEAAICTCARPVALSSAGAWHSMCHGTRTFLDMIGAQVTPDGRLCVARNLCPVTLQAPIPLGAWERSMAPADWAAAVDSWPEKRTAVLSNLVGCEVDHSSVPSGAAGLGSASAAEAPLKSAAAVQTFLQTTVLPDDDAATDMSPSPSVVKQGPHDSCHPPQPAEQSAGSPSTRGSCSPSPASSEGQAGAGAGQARSSHADANHGDLVQQESIGFPPAHAACSAMQGASSDDSSSSADTVSSMERLAAMPGYEDAFLAALRSSCRGDSPQEGRCAWPGHAGVAAAKTYTLQGEEMLEISGLAAHPSGSVTIRNNRGIAQTLNVRREVLYLIDLALEHAAPGTHCARAATEHRQDTLYSQR